MSRYRIVRLSETAVAVERWTDNSGWVQAVSFSGLYDTNAAKRWIAHEEDLDQLDNT